MTAAFADAGAASDLLDVFSSYDGSVIFRGLTESIDGQPAIFGRLGWIFTSFGVLFVLWGFVLRSRSSEGEAKLGEIAKTWVVIGCMVGGPFLMRAAMEAADAVYAGSPGNPRNLTVACVKAAYAMPELNQLFDVLRAGAASQAQANPATSGAQRLSLVNSANDGSVLGYLEAFGYAVWDTAANYADGAGQTWTGMVRTVSIAAGLGSAMLKCLLIAATIAPLYLLLLAAGAVVWFMDQLRYFLAVSGTMMLPLFVGMFSMPAGHFNRQAAQAYVMNMVSLALWPVSWAIGHVGTIALYNALISLVAGTSRVPEIMALLQWSAITSPGPGPSQVQAAEAALGNWFMGNLAGLLSILVGAAGFMTWVLVVSVFGPVFLHRLLATGALFMTQALSATRQHGMSGARFGVAAAQSAASSGWALPSASVAAAGERLAAAPPVHATPVLMGIALNEVGPTSMGEAARRVDDSDGKGGSAV